MAVTKPLMLKDFLALDSNSECVSKMNRSYSKRTLTKISSAFNSFFLRRSVRKMSPEKEVESVRVIKEVARLNSFEIYSQRSSLYFPSPVRSSFSSFSGSASDNSSECNGVCDAQLSCQHQEIKEEEKEQFSPVSVMKFPCDEEDDNKDENDNDNLMISSHFEESLANIERTRDQLMQNIRRFESLANLVDAFSNFEDFVSYNDEDDDNDNGITSMGLIRRLKSVGSHKHLLLDFFEEELTLTDNIDELLTAAESWIEGEGYLTVKDHGKAQIKDMERNGRWMSLEGDKEDTVADLEVRMMGSLLEELVLDLVS